MNTFLMKNDKVGHGEDAAYVCDDFAVVCDGLGGSGSNVLMFDGKERSEAQTASSLCSMAVRNFFNEEIVNDWKTFIAENLSPDDRKAYLEEMAYALRHHIVNFMKKECTAHGVDMETIKALPTTLALAVYMDTPDCTEVTAFWAGDSRVYTLSPTGGLQQLSRDDTVEEEFDANEQIGYSTMTGCVSYTYPFKINFLHHRLEKTEDRLIFCCSDGCFDGLKSIMLLEYVLLDKLMQLKDDDAPESFIDSVRDAYVLGEVYGEGLIDDTSMAGRIFGATDVKRLKKKYLARYANIKEIREIVNEWLTELNQINCMRPSPETDADIFERYGDFAVDTAIRALEGTPADWEELIFANVIADLPVFSRYRARRSEIKPETSPDSFARREELSALRREFDDAYLKLLCFSRENRDYAFRKLERGLAGHLGFELDSFARQLEIAENFREMREELIGTLYDLKCFYDVFEDGSGSQQEFLESLSDTVEQMSQSADLAYRLLNSDHGKAEEALEAERWGLLSKLDDNGITNEGFATWYDMGMPPFGDDVNYERLERLVAESGFVRPEETEADRELAALLNAFAEKTRDKIIEQFLRTPGVIYNECLDKCDGIRELRDWLSGHMRADKAADEAYSEVGKIWRFHYKTMYEQYKKAVLAGRA